MTRRPAAIAVFVASLGLIGCADAGVERDAAVAGHDAPPATGEDSHETAGTLGLGTYAYDCDDGSYVVANFDGQERLWLFLPGKTISLPRARSASGARYSDGVTTFWINGREATLETAAARAPITCVENRAASVIEDAKLRGNDFWAIGNEPGWTLEIGPDSTVVVSGYGSERYAFATPQPAIDATALRTVWEGEARGTPITIEIVAEECFDDMSGEPYGAQVEVTLGKQRLRGCGQALH